MGPSLWASGPSSRPRVCVRNWSASPPVGSRTARTPPGVSTSCSSLIVRGGCWAQARSNARTPHSEGISRWYGSPVFQGSDCDVCATLGAAAEVCGAGQIHRCLGQGVQCLTGFRWWHQHDAQRPSFCPLPRRRLAGVVPVQHCLLAESLQDADIHGRWSLSAVTGWLQ